MELRLCKGEEPVKSLWVRTTAQIKRTRLVGIFFRSPDQVEIDETFFRQSRETWFLQALVLMGEYN